MIYMSYSTRFILWKYKNPPAFSLNSFYSDNASKFPFLLSALLSGKLMAWRFQFTYPFWGIVLHFVETLSLERYQFKINNNSNNTKQKPSAPTKFHLHVIEKSGSCQQLSHWNKNIYYAINCSINCSGLVQTCLDSLQIYSEILAP